MQVRNQKALEYGLEGVENVLYFTHDYFSMAHGKNDMLWTATKTCKQVGVKNFVAVCPIEYDMYTTDSTLKDSIKLRSEAEADAFKNFPTMTLLRPNLVFGDYTYFMRYLEQSAIVGSVPESIVSPTDPTKYHPIHEEDLYKVVMECLNNSKHQGQTYSVNGADNVTLVQIMEFIK